MNKFSAIEYKRPDFERVSESFNQLLVDFDNAKSAQEQSLVFNKINTLRNEFQTYASIASVRNSIDTTNAYYELEKQFYDDHEPLFRDLNIRLYRALGNTPFKADLQQKFGNQIFNIAEVSLKSFDTSVIEDLKEENRLGTEYTKIIATATVEFNGERMNFSQLEPFEQGQDRAVREKAVRAKYAVLEKSLDDFDRIFDRLVKVRTNIAKKLGYKNFVELAYHRMQRTDYNAADVAVFRDQIFKYVVPVSTALRERQAKRLGLDKFTVYDMGLMFNTGNPNPKGSPEWIIENGKRMYTELSPETKEFFDFMVNNELMDLVTKQGKAAGGYCTHFPMFKAPFIFSNFNGTSHDIDVLTHEAGHAFQFFQSRHFELDEYCFPTYEACEIHSMSMEYFSWPWMELFFKEDAEKYKFAHLSAAVLFLPYGAAVDEFQHIIYENPDLTPAERRKVWLDMEQKYRPYIDYSGIPFLEAGGLWMRQLHIYRSPFYYIDYCLAQICAFQFWQKSNNDFKAAWADYLALCKAGGSKTFLELVKLANLNSPFDVNSIQSVMTDVSAWLNKVDDSKM
ncbi:MAG: M3 family oligoendopeptidase [Chitinophagales bacterium]|nr:M3 family oligoendopeptidase [Chitinophagales bacterium]